MEYLEYSCVIYSIENFLDINDLISLNLTNKNISRNIDLNYNINKYIRSILYYFYKTVKNSNSLYFKKNTNLYINMRNLIFKTLSNDNKYYKLFINNLNDVINTNIDNTMNIIYKNLLDEYLYHKNSKKRYKLMTTYDSLLTSVYYNYFNKIYK